MFNKNYFNSSVGLDLLRSDLASTIIQSVRDNFRHTTLVNNDKHSIYKFILDCYYKNNIDGYFKYKSEALQTKYVDIYRCVVETFLDYFDLTFDFDFDYDFSTFFTVNIHEAVIKSVFSRDYTSYSVLTLYNEINSHKIETHHSVDNSDVVIDSYESLKNYSNLCRMLDSDPSVHDCGIDNDDISIISKTCNHYDWAFIIPNDYGYAVRYKAHNGFIKWYTYCVDAYDLGYDYDDDNLLFDDEVVPCTYFFNDLLEYIKSDLELDTKVILLTSTYFNNSEAAA